MTQTGRVTPGTNYTVQTGDSLSHIAELAYGNAANWHLIYEANKQVIGNNPDNLLVGQVLHIPLLSPTVDLHLQNSTEIQGDILAAFNKDHRVYLFLKLPNQANGRAWLKELAPLIAKTKEVADFNTRFSASRAANGGKDPANLKATWVNVSLTYNGLKLLLKSDPAKDLNNQGFTSFVTGPVQQAAANGDTLLSDPQHWLVGGSNQTIHALLNVQSDVPADLTAEVQRQKALAIRHGLTVVFEQAGETLPNPLTGHEHFGFKDGISQPGVAGFDLPDPHDPINDPTATLGHVLKKPGTEIIKAGEFVLGEDVEADSGGQKFSPPSSLHWMLNGSFLVFRRLRQDVGGFVAQENANLASLPANDPLHGSLGAKLVGRWKSGTPIDLSPDRDNNLTDDGTINKFEFSNDKQGLRCPRFAHIRKVYPRDGDAFGNRGRRIIRRGVPYGLPFGGHTDNVDRGLLFFAYMSSIEAKFEFLMQVWVNPRDFPFDVPPGGPDPIIGDAQPRPAPNTLHRQGQPDFEKDFQRFVHTSGAVYAFAPSITALQEIANGLH